MLSVTDNMREWASRLKEFLGDLQGHSSVHRWNYPGGGVIFLGGDYGWDKLGDEGRQAQSRLLEEYRRFSALLATFLAGQPNDALAAMRKADGAILAAIQQEGTLWDPEVEAPFRRADEAIDQLVGLMGHLYDGSAGRPTYAPDTNALLFNPSLEDWRFEEAPRFVILLLPTVLAELDALKVSHRVEGVRQKAERLIGQLKEYRRRGRLTEGVTLVKGVSDVVAVAAEPVLAGSLPWLDAANQDDRLLASVIEAMRMRPHSPLVLVTRDINLQNKAEFARVPFCEPPDPKAT